MALDRKSNGTFAPGVSGNRNGRPRKVRPQHRMPSEVHDVFMKGAEEVVSVRTPDGVQEITAWELVVKAILRDAAKGKLGAQKLAHEAMMKASQEHGQRTEIVRGLAVHIMRLQNRVLELERLVPPTQRNGVFVEMPDGTFLPNSYLRQLADE